jgi:hypothetical protein
MLNRFLGWIGVEGWKRGRAFTDYSQTILYTLETFSIPGNFKLNKIRINAKNYGPKSPRGYPSICLHCNQKSTLGPTKYPSKRIYNFFFWYFNLLWSLKLIWKFWSGNQFKTEFVQKLIQDRYLIKSLCFFLAGCTQDWFLVILLMPWKTTSALPCQNFLEVNLGGYSFPNICS